MASIHDPIFDLPSRPMFRWGESPFRVRGVAYRSTLPMVDDMLAKRGLRAADLLRQNGDAALDAFLTQRFAPMDFYDIYPMIHFAPLVARARGVSLSQHTRDSASVHAAWARRGFTSVILRLVSNETVAAWIPRISAWYHDFGDIETTVAGDRHVRGVRHGLPQFLVQSWSILSMQFTEDVLSHAGASDPRAYTLDAERDGERQSCPLYRVSFEIRWS